MNRSEELIRVLNAGVIERDARIDTLTGWYANALNVINECSEALPGVAYMDQPDGGSVSVQEQVRRMRQDCDQLRAELAVLRERVPVEYQQLSRYGNWDRIDKVAFDLGMLSTAPERFRPLYAAPVAKQVVMPERKKWDASAGSAENMKSAAYNAALDAVARLNAADQEGGV
jgi:hypothetical protein